MDHFSNYAYNLISEHWDKWMYENGIDGKSVNWVVAVSGGKDSSVVAALAVRKFGKDRVIGVTLPCDEQSDFDDSMRLINHLGIEYVNINIGDAVSSILNGVENNAIDVSYDTRTNLPARIRMASVYAVAQSMNGIVLNTANLTESILGYCSLFGDDCGSYAPIKGLTVTEVICLGDFLGLPYELTHKIPMDGLQPLTDEEKLGMKYSDIDKFIRNNEGSKELKGKVLNLYAKNRFKTRIVNVPGCEFVNLLNFPEKLS